jgi:hypothetical protein
MTEIRPNAKKQKDIRSEKAASKNDQKPEKLDNEIKFDYIKSNQFRVIHVDGAHGGVTPRGLIQMAFFSERVPIPKRETYSLEQGKLGQRKEVEQRDAIIREVEVETLLDVKVAKVIVRWLGERITKAEKVEKLMKGTQ